MFYYLIVSLTGLSCNGAASSEVYILVVEFMGTARLLKGNGKKEVSIQATK